MTIKLQDFLVAVLIVVYLSYYMAETMMRVKCYWSKLEDSKYGYLGWGIIWPATNINIVWNYFLILKIVFVSVGTGLFKDIVYILIALYSEKVS